MSAITDTLLAADDSPTPTPWFAFSSAPSRFWCGFWSLMLAVCVPFLVPYFQSLWRQELYQYFPFLLLAVGYLTYHRWDRVWRGPAGRVARTIGFVALGLLILAAAIHSSWLGALAFVMLATVFLISQRSASGGSLAYLALPLIMLLRVPQLHAQSIVVRLQRLTSSLSSLVLDVLGVPQDTFANAIHLPNKDLFVAEACSGIQSAFTMCFLALLLVVWRRRPLATAPLYCVAALALAVLSNTMRVSVIAVAHAWYTVDLSTGWMHDAVGYASLAAAATLLLSFDRFAVLLFHPVEVSVNRRGANPLSVVWNYALGAKPRRYDAWENPRVHAPNQEQNHWRMPRWPLGMAAVGSLASLVMVAGLVLGRSDQRPIVAKDAVLFDPPQDFLQGRVGMVTLGDHAVVRNGSDPQLGIHADTWRCASDGIQGRVVLSQPYVGWHELCVCYEVQDWELRDRYNHTVQQGQPVAVGEFVNASGLHGYLIFTAVDSDGGIPTPPSYTLFGRVLAPFGPLITDDFAETSGSAQTIMLQLWTVSDQPIDPDEINRLADSVAENARPGTSGRRSPASGNGNATMMYYLNPLTWLLWIRQFAFAWLVGIRWQGAAYAIPAVLVLVLMVAGTALAWSGSNSWRNGWIDSGWQQALQRKDFTTAELLLRRQVRYKAGDVDLQLQLARTLNEMGKSEESQELYQQLALEDRSAAAARWLLANDLKPTESRQWTADQVEMYGRLTEVLVDQAPEDPVANEFRADYLIRSGKPLEAMPHLEKLAPHRPVRGLQLAALLRSQGELERAEQHAMRVLARVEQSVADEPRNVELRLLQAQVLLFLERYRDAVRTLHEGHKLTGDAQLRGAVAEALVLYANSLEKEAGRTDVAAIKKRLTALQLALQHAPAHPAVVRAVADTVLATIQEEDAQVAALRESLIEGSSPSLSHFIRGTAAMIRGDAQIAEVELELAAKGMPNTAAILNNLAVARAQTAKTSGNPKALAEALTMIDRAIVLAEKSDSRDKQLAYFHETRAQILLAQGQHLEAVHAFEKALAVPELKRQVHRGLATAYEALGQTELAASHASKAAPPL